MKFQERKIKKRYKRKEYTSRKFVMEFPVNANPKIEPHKEKTFDDVDITSKETINQEFLNIQLVRNKSPKEINKGNAE